MSLRQEKKQQARQDILTAARDLIDQRGYRHAKMRDIAATARLSYQTLYNYFPTKALILQALLVEDAAHIAAQINELVANHAAGTTALLPTLHAIYRADMDAISQRDRELWRVVAVDFINQEGEAAHIYQLINATSHDTLMELLSAAQASGELTGSTNVTLLADTLFAISHHSVWRYIMEPRAAKGGLLEALEAQTELLVGPYLVG